MQLTQEIVRELLDYNPETGKLTWKNRDGKWFKDTEKRTATHSCNQWNSKNANTEAFRNISKTTGHKCGSIFYKLYKSHRIIWLWQTGEWPKEQIDHINRIRHDNRWINLREVSNLENQKNKNPQKNNSSGRNGVYKLPNGDYQVSIGVNGKSVYIGYAHSFEEAVALREKADKKYDFSENHGVLID